MADTFNQLISTSLDLDFHIRSLNSDFISLQQSVNSVSSTLSQFSNQLMKSLDAIPTPQIVTSTSAKKSPGETVIGTVSDGFDLVNNLHGIQEIGETIDDILDVGKWAALGTSITSIIPKIGAAGSALLALLGPVGVVVAALGGIGIAAGIAVNEHNKAIDEAVVTAQSNLSQTQSALGSVNLELEKVNSNIQDLESNNIGSVVNEGDLEKLRMENNELRLRKKLLEEEERNNKIELDKASRKKYEKEYGEQFTSENDIKFFEYQLSERRKLKESGDYNSSSLTAAPYDASSMEYSRHVQVLNTMDDLGYNVAMHNVLNKLQSENERSKDVNFTDEDREILADATSSLLAERKNLQSHIDGMSASGETSSDLTDATRNLALIDEALFGKDENLLNYLANSVSAEQMKVLLNKAQNDALNLTDLSSEFRALYNFMGKNSSTVSDLSSLLIDSTVSLDAYSNIPNIFANSNFDTLTSDAEKCQTAIEALHKSSLDDSDVFNLINLFPELIPYINMTAEGFGDLENGLNHLAGVKLDTLISSLESFQQKDAMGNLLDNEENQNIENIINGVEKLKNEVTNISLLDTVKEEFETFQSISEGTLASIGNAFPEMEQPINDFKNNIISSKELIQSLESVYQQDADAYREHCIQKKLYDNDFYNTVLANLDENTKKLLEKYGIEFGKFKTVQELKTEVVKAAKQKQLEIENLENNSTSNPFNNPAINPFRNPLLNFNLPENENVKKAREAFEKEQKEKILNAKKENEEIAAIFNGIDTSINISLPWETGNDKPNKTSPGNTGKSNGNDNKRETEEKFKGSIDWSEQGLTNLDRELKYFQRRLENANTLDKQSKVQNRIIGTQEEISKFYKDVTNSSEAQYTKDLNALGKNKTSYQKKIESKKPLKLEDFDNKEIYNNAKKAQDSYNKSQENKAKYKNQENIVRQEKEKLIQLELDDTKAKIDMLKAKNSSYDSAPKKNENLQNQLPHIIKSFDLQIKQAKTSEEKEKLKREKNVAITENSKEQFDNVTNGYDSKASVLSSQSSVLNKKLELNEAKGIASGTAYYTKLISLQKTQSKQLKAELKSQEQILADSMASGAIKLNCPAYNEWVSQINEIKTQIDDCTISTLEFSKALDQIRIDNLNLMLDKFSALQKESDFLIDLMSSQTLLDEKGDYTSAGVAVQGQHAQNYDNYLYQAQQSKNELKILDDKYSKLKIGDAGYEDYISTRNHLLTSSQDAIMAAENEKKAIVDLCKNGIDAKINSYKEMIDKQKEALDAEKELSDFQSELTRKQQDTALIQKRLNALKNDDSLENRKLKKDLEKQLKESTDDLNSFEKDKNMKDQKESLDSNLETYQKSQENYLKDTDKVFSDTLDIVNKNSTNIAATITTTATKAGYTISKEITSAWYSAGNSVTNFYTTFSETTGGMLSQLDGIKNAYLDSAKAAEAFASAAIDDFDKDNTNLGRTQLEKNVYKILGTASNENKNLADTAGTELNRYVMNMGYNKLSYSAMLELGKALGLSKLTIEDVHKGSVRSDILDLLKKVKGFEPIYTTSDSFKTGMIETQPFLQKMDSGLTDKLGQSSANLRQVMPSAVGMLAPFTSAHFPAASATAMINPAAPIEVSVNAPLIQVENLDENLLLRLKNDRTIQKTIQEITLEQTIVGIKNVSAGVVSRGVY